MDVIFIILNILIYISIIILSIFGMMMAILIFALVFNLRNNLILSIEKILYSISNFVVKDESMTKQNKK